MTTQANLAKSAAATPLSFPSATAPGQQETVKAAVCGAGPVGMALAGFLLARGMPAVSIALIDARSLEQARQDPRSIAVSWGSRQLLEQIRAWPAATTAIQEIHVSRRGRFGRTLIRAQDYDLPALGYVVRYGDLVAALGAALSSAPLRALRPARVGGVAESSDDVMLAIEGAPSLRAEVAVLAEGGLFHEQEIGKQPGAQTRDYQQTAIVARVTTADRLPHKAFERFTAEGPLALLPQEDGHALVWCMRPQSAERVMALDDAAFLQALQEAFGQRLGRFLTTSPRVSYPLGLNARTGSTARTVSIGNAAQTLHPVAGQGLNLGLRDAAVLAGLLARLPAPEAILAFARHRQADRRLSVGITDLMARAFTKGDDAGPLQSILGLGLGVLDGIAPAKRALAEQMMFGWR